jgi:hypothetical protein
MFECNGNGMLTFPKLVSPLCSGRFPGPSASRESALSMNTSIISSLNVLGTVTETDF